MSGSASTTSPRSESLAYHLKDLQNEIKSQQREIKGLKKEIDVLQEQVKVKDELIESWTAKERLLEERALEAETEVKSWKKRSKKWDEERRRLQAETDAANSEADRLNQSMLASAGNNSKAMNGSMEDVVRLHNQLSESRKDIHRLKDEIKSLENMIKAKDAAIEEGQAQIEMAVEANAMRQHDQNIIIDLNRQIKDLQEQLGGEHQYGKLAESEIGEIRNALAQKDAEMEELLEALEGQREEVREAKELKAHADSLIAQAAEKMARSVQISEKAVAAEAERMAAGGFVPKDVHDVELASVRSELDSYKEIVRSIKEENVHAKVFLKRLTGSVGDEIDKVVCSQEVAEQFGNSMFTIKELKSEVKSLQDIVASKEGVILAMQASKAAADVRATQLAVECTNMKMHLAKALGEYEYTLLTNEPPPTDVDSAALEAKARAAEAQEESSSFETLYRKQLDLEEENQALASQVRDMKVEVSEMEEGLETKVCSAREEAEKEASRLSEAVQEKDLHIEELKSQNVSLVSTIESLTQEKEKLTLEKQTLEEKQDDTEVVPLGTYNDISEKYERLLKDFEDMKSERHRALEMPSIAPVVVHNESVEPRGDAAPTVMKTPQKPNPSEESGQMDQYITPKATHSATSSLENSPKKMFAMHQQQGIVSPEALSTILDSLLLAKQGSGQVEDETLYNDAIQMLQEELSKLSIKMANDSDTAAQLKTEVGDLKTAQLSAKTTAEILESYNTMSMKLASQKIVMAQKEAAFAKHEQQLLAEISTLRAEIRRLKGKSALKSVKKAFSSTVKGIKKSLDGGSTKDVSDLGTVSPLQEHFEKGLEKSPSK